MAARELPPFRADHVGSLLRPRRLRQARDDFAADRIRVDELREIEDESIRDVIRMQEGVGLQTATDGEFRRASWHMDFIYALDGISKAPGDLKVEFRNAEGTIEFTRRPCTSMASWAYRNQSSATPSDSCSALRPERRRS